jgi:hypothetical protein
MSTVDKKYSCKDCLGTYSNAAEFTEHIPECVPVANSDILLKDAVTLLRRFVVKMRKGVLIGRNPGEKEELAIIELADATVDWMKRNGLQGSALRQ